MKNPNRYAEVDLRLGRQQSSEPAWLCWRGLTLPVFWLLLFLTQPYVLAVPRLVRRGLIGQAYLPKGGSHGSSEAVS